MIKAWVQYWFDHRWFLVFAAGLFLAGLISGWFYHEPFQDLMDLVLQQLSEDIGFETTGTALFFQLSVNNMLAALATVVLGLFFGLFPVVTMLLNGFVVGGVVSMTAESGADLLSLIAFGILPHGIFEIPAIVLAAAYGLKLGTLMWQSVLRLFGSGMRQRFPARWKHSLRQGVLTAAVVLVLLAVAAVVESTVTAGLIRHI